MTKDCESDYLGNIINHTGFPFIAIRTKIEGYDLKLCIRCNLYQNNKSQISSFDSSNHELKLVNQCETGFTAKKEKGIEIISHYKEYNKTELYLSKDIKEYFNVEDDVNCFIKSC